MAKLVAFLLSLTITIYLSAAERSHDVYLTRVENGYQHPEWITNETHKINKVDKYRKSLDLNFTLLQDITVENLVCQIKVFQKTGAKYMKAPVDVPPTPCCALMDGNGIVWKCIRVKMVQTPEKCPITKGIYQMKGFDPYECEYPKNLPPNGPEDFRIEFIGLLGSMEVFKHIGYGKMKKRMQLGPI